MKFNLLPEKNKEKNRRRFLYRRLIVVTAVFSSLIFTACIFLLAIYFHLFFGGTGEKEKGRTLAELSSTDQLLVKKIQSISKKLAIISPTEDAILPSVAVSAAVNDKGGKVNLHHLALECQAQTKVCEMAVLGRAEDRQSLLDYVAKLKQNKMFNSVESPINNLINDKDSQFSLSLETNPMKDF